MKKGNKDKFEPAKVEQSVVKKDKEKPNVVNKFVKPSQSSKEKKDKSTNPNEKKI